MVSPIVQKLEIEYPESDGEPMGETETHIRHMLEFLLHPLITRYRDRPDVYVMGNMFLYYEEGNPSAVVAPDTFVIFNSSKFGTSKEVRRTYKLWEEGKPPDVIFELTSKKTYRADLTDKRFLYEELGVKEYFLFDPLYEYLRPPLQGFRLVDDYYIPVVAEQIMPGVWELESEQLGLILRTVDNNLRLYDPLTEQYLLSSSEEAEERLREEKRRQKAEEEKRVAEEDRQVTAARLVEAEVEIARLKRLLGDTEQNS